MIRTLITTATAAIALAIATMAALLLTSSEAAGQVAVKTNLLYDATTTPNLGLEVAVGRKNTLNVVYGINPWTFNEGRKVKHWVVQPEYRWWLCSAYNGHFFGVHALGGQYNACKVDLPVPGAFFGGDNLHREVKNSRYQGWFAGAGVTYGYQWIFSRHFNMEAEIGVGYGHLWYDRYPCASCGTKISEGGTNYVGVTKAALSLMYLF